MKQLAFGKSFARLGLLVLALGLSGSAEAELGFKVELFTNHVEESTRFYGVLGFEVAHRKAADDYTTLRNGGAVLALSPLPRWLPASWLGFLRFPPLGTEIVFYPDSLEDARRALLEAGYDPGDIALQSWGDRDFRVRDPDGYYVRISEGAPVPSGD